VDAVALNVTTTGGTSPTSYVSVCPADQSLEDCKRLSNPNAYSGDNIPDLVIATLDAEGFFQVYNDAGDQHIVIHVQGAFFEGDVDTSYVPVAPSRVLDSRDPSQPGAGEPIGEQGSISLDLGALGHVPPEADAVVLNVTATQSTAGNTYVSVCPEEEWVDCSETSNLNVYRGRDTAHLVTVMLSDLDTAIATTTWAAPTSSPTCRATSPTGPDRSSSTARLERPPVLGTGGRSHVTAWRRACAVYRPVRAVRSLSAVTASSRQIRTEARCPPHPTTATRCETSHHLATTTPSARRAPTTHP